VRLQPQVVEYGPARVSVSGISAGSVSVRLRGAPPLRGLYQLQFRVEHPEHFLQSPR
jgi:hypothetical protein